MDIWTRLFLWVHAICLAWNRKKVILHFSSSAFWKKGSPNPAAPPPPPHSLGNEKMTNSFLLPVLRHSTTPSVFKLHDLLDVDVWQNQITLILRLGGGGRWGGRGAVHNADCTRHWQRDRERGKGWRERGREREGEEREQVDYHKRNRHDNSSLLLNVWNTFSYLSISHWNCISQLIERNCGQTSAQREVLGASEGTGEGGGVGGGCKSHAALRVTRKSPETTAQHSWRDGVCVILSACHWSLAVTLHRHSCRANNSTLKRSLSIHPFPVVQTAEFRSCVKAEVAVLGFPSDWALSPFLTGPMFVRWTYFGQFDELWFVS